MVQTDLRIPSIVQSVESNYLAQNLIEGETGLGVRPKQDKVCLESMNLSIGFGDKSVLNDITLKFPNGTITALVGPTGCGKSTFLRTLNRMNDQVRGFWHNGVVKLDGVETYSKAIDPLILRRRVGMVFQRPNPFPMSISDNVTAGVKAHKMAKRRELKEIAVGYLKEVGLYEAVKDRFNDSPFRLSGGQQQLLCLARALAVKPEVLLLDEPTASLDPISTKSVEDLLIKLAPELTIVIVTHNLAQARRIADKAAFFCDGMLVENGDAAQVLEDPTHETTAQFVTGRLG